MTTAESRSCTWFVQSGVCPRVGKSGLGQGERCYQYVASGASPGLLLCMLTRLRIHPAPGARSRGNALAVDPQYNAEPCAITADTLLLWLRRENPAATELDARLLIVGAVPCPGYMSPAGCQFGNVRLRLRSIV